MKHAFVAETLTAAERATPFLDVDPDFEPIDKPTRVAVEWDGPSWTEFDPSTGAQLATGSIAAEQ